MPVIGGRAIAEVTGGAVDEEGGGGALETLVA